MPRYERPWTPHEWIQPVMDGYRAACCDCGLVHLFNFRVLNSKTGKVLNNVTVQFQVYRHVRATAAVRRKAHPFTKKKETP
jgi:hypothetical protein